MSQIPYPPSWVDRFIAWIERLPGPSVAFYAAVFLIATILLHVAAGIDGAVDWGTADLGLVYNASWTIVGLGVLHAVGRVAARSLERFRPVIGGPEGSDLEYRLTTMPFRTLLVLTLVAAGVITAAFAASPDFIYDGMDQPISWVLGGAVVVSSYTFAPILVYYLVRQLALVRRAFASVPEVSVLHQQPLYGLSRIPFASGLAFLAIINVSLLEMAVRETTDAERFLNIATSLALVVVAIAAFLVPVLGIHDRLKQAKEALLDENGRHIEIAQARLYESVRSGDPGGVGDADTAMSSLYRVRDEIGKVRTWPWSPGTVRSFLSAVFIPMVIWALQLLGDRIS